MERQFPITLKHAVLGCVVRFTSRNGGTVIEAGNMYEKGFHSKHWISAYDKYMWEEV